VIDWNLSFCLNNPPAQQHRHRAAPPPHSTSLALTPFHHHRRLPQRAKRYIMSFGASEPFLHAGLECVRLTVEGQSFLLHHIRKMIAMAVEVVRGVVGEALFAASLTETKVDLPLVPGVGLYLNRVFFENYRRKFANDHDALDFDEPATQRSVQLFKWEHIIRPAIEIELRERPFFTWLQVMAKHPLSYEEMSIERFEQKRKALYIQRRDDKDIALTRDA
jgi:hypothetical protein